MMIKRDIKKIIKGVIKGDLKISIIGGSRRKEINIIGVRIRDIMVIFNLKELE